ncbi:hypothetical protein EYF80_064033 [Liparis tanakae]|uniref:Uncharacterized protein n=1 Tax=Liparis tanakae TaxID=230148 RepID=A0A4Z2EAQ7_9TELE|nr:hypothetical protein EYF80_064033 [Liparis tanakae]
MSTNSFSRFHSCDSGCCHALTPGTPHSDPGLPGFPSAWTDGPCADMKPSSGGLAPGCFVQLLTTSLCCVQGNSDINVIDEILN